MLSQRRIKSDANTGLSITSQSLLSDTLYYYNGLSEDELSILYPMRITDKDLSLEQKPSSSPAPTPTSTALPGFLVSSAPLPPTVVAALFATSVLQYTVKKRKADTDVVKNGLEIINEVKESKEVSVTELSDSPSVYNGLFFKKRLTEEAPDYLINKKDVYNNSLFFPDKINIKQLLAFTGAQLESRLLIKNVL